MTQFQLKYYHDILFDVLSNKVVPGVGAEDVIENGSDRLKNLFLGYLVIHLVMWIRIDCIRIKMHKI